ncbi:DnaT-like ssDNA-binding protein [Ramlibacter sp. AN1015]|uniref:DnaT-like ssDNA-binding protein n=1 Tax=Ramlibacter sp. AN1015 TaxID=3133428 RepID=UPI0030BC9C60
MALIIETGAGVTGANSYADLVFAASYHTALGNEDWVGSDADLTHALIVACRALEQLYGSDLKSALSSAAQERLFPRKWFTDNLGRIVQTGTIPACWKEAQCEIALMLLQEKDVFPTAADGAIKSQSITVGEYSESTEYHVPVQKEKHAGFRRVELLLAPILNKKPSGWRLRA